MLIKIKDSVTQEVKQVEIEIESTGIAIKPENTGCYEGDWGPIYVEFYNGMPTVYIWDDINKENPRKINLAGALESNRNSVQ